MLLMLLSACLDALNILAHAQRAPKYTKSQISGPSVRKLILFPCFFFTYPYRVGLCKKKLGGKYLMLERL
jgi:hypothetical protein